MTEAPAMSTETEVRVDQTTAFKAFTEELDRWWLAGPINYFDSARAIGMRCESGVGGRLVEVYDAATGDGLELGRITTWEPGERIIWASSVDDIEMTVRFEPVTDGTRVVVEARLPAGGRHEGGAAWINVAPAWFSAWCERRDQQSPDRPSMSRLAVSISYARPATAARWIADVLGLTTTLPLPPIEADGNDGDHMWIEFRVGDGVLVVLKAEDTNPSASHVPWIFVDDLDSHHQAAVDAGATIVEGIHSHGYRGYTVADPEGHHWTIAQSLPAVHHPG